MRVWEILIVGLLLTSALHMLWLGKSNTLFLYCFLSLTALAAHIAFEGAHWQMGPAYLGTLALLTLSIIKGPAPRLAAILPAGLALCSCGLSAILPMFQLPPPTGPFTIGTRILTFVDNSRVETNAKGVRRPRELVVQIWYPAERSRNPLAPYRRLAETTLISSYQSVTWTHSRWGAPITQLLCPVPILIFNPAWNGRRTQNTYLVEDLASHGYFVVGIDHPGNSGPIAFPDGRVSRPLPVPGMDFSINSFETIDATADAELRQQTHDSIFTLDQLQSMANDPKSEFYQCLNARNVGVFGHSFGGAVGAQLCYLDDRVRSAFDMDGSLFGEVSRRGLRKPFLFISEDTQLYSPQQIEQFGHQKRIDAQLDRRDQDMFERSSGYRIYLHGSSHSSFTDAHIFSPFKRLVDGGRIPASRQFLIVREYALAFFDKTLRNYDPSLLRNARAPFPEVSVIMHTAPAND